MEFLGQYGLFLAETMTIVVSILVLLAFVFSASNQQKESKGSLKVVDLTEKFFEESQNIKQGLMSKKEAKRLAKAFEKEEKQKAKAIPEEEPNRLFVIDFKGSIDAKEVNCLREEVTGVLAVADAGDEVLVRLESSGGAVHGYGLAAAQLERLRAADLKLTVSVDKVAASGGYMMACVGEKILSAPFALVGSIGVIGQLPNFNRVLKKNNIDFEQHTAGEYKRTLTMLGPNDERGREKFKQDLERIHKYFKQFVVANRPNLNIDKVATGEYWLGREALDLGLVDEIKTSDAYLLDNFFERQVVSLEYCVKKTLRERLGDMQSVLNQKLYQPLFEVGQRFMS